MWTPDTLAEHDRDDLRYPSDLSDGRMGDSCGRCFRRRQDGPKAQLAHAGNRQCDLLCAARRLSVADAAQAFPPHQTTYA